jgi:hypothetical protein
MQSSSHYSIQYTMSSQFVLTSYFLVTDPNNILCLHPYWLANVPQLTHCFNCRLSESELLYDWRFASNFFVLVISPLRLTTSNYFFQLNTCLHSPYVTSSLTRGWACRLQLLLALASSVILRSESRGTHDHILLSQIRDSPHLEDQVPVFISPMNRVARLYPRHWIPFSSPPTTRRATVEVFDPASTRANCRLSTNYPGYNISARTV